MTFAVVGVLGVPFALLLLWVVAPSLPGRLESTDGFHWLGEEPGSGRPLLLREQFDGRQIIAGSDRFGLAREEPLACYAGPVDALRDAARARGRIEDLAASGGMFHRLTLRFDDLGGGASHHLYRCTSGGVQPLLSWDPLPGFGARSLVLTWLTWVVVGLAVVSGVRRLRRR